MSYIYPEASQDAPYTGPFKCNPIEAPGFSVLVNANLSSIQYGCYQYDHIGEYYSFNFLANGAQYWAVNGNVIIKICSYERRTGVGTIYNINDFNPLQYDSETGLYYALVGATSGEYLTNLSNQNFIFSTLREALDACDLNRPPEDQQYTVVFNGNGGQGTMSDQSINTDEPTPLSANTFTRNEYTFIGWATSPNGEVVYQDEEVVTNIAEPLETITLYAVWQPTPLSIHLQYNASEKNKLDKEVTTVIQLSGALKQETSIIDPVIIIQGDLITISQCNYMTISKFGRSYFITNIRSIRTNLVEVSGHVDVLSSFKSQIRQNTAIIHKQEFDWNLYLNDGTFKVFSNPIVETYEFPSGFTGTFQYVMAVAGGQGQTPTQNE